MRLLTSLLFIPFAIGLLLALAIPGSLGIIVGIAAIMLYYGILVIRASDWTWMAL